MLSKVKSKKVLNIHVLSVFTSISVHILALFLANLNLNNILFVKQKTVHKNSESVQVVELDPIEEVETLAQPLQSLNIQNSSKYNNSAIIPKTFLPDTPKRLSTSPITNFAEDKNDTLTKDKPVIKPTNKPTKNNLRENEIKEIELPKKKLLNDKPVDESEDINTQQKEQLGESIQEYSSFEKLRIKQMRQNKIAENLLKETLKGSEKLIYNHIGTQRAEARQKDIEWMQKTGIALKLNQMITIEGSYPKSACNLNLRGSAVYNIFVNKSGKLNGSPFMTQSSGYGILNDQGLDDIKSYNFSQSTRVRVIFQPNYDKCPNLTKIDSPMSPSDLN